MKKFLICLGILLVILIIISSRNNISSMSIENLAYVIAIGIDNGNNDLITLTLQIATPSSSSSDSSSSKNSEQSSEATTTTVECSTITSGINMVNSYISKKLNLSHCKIIVFSEEYAKSGISDEIATLTNNIEIRPDCSIVISKCMAKDFIEINQPVLVTLTARYYEVVVHSGDYTGYSKNVTLLDFYTSIKNDCYEPIAILAGINIPSTHILPSGVNYVDLESSYSAGQAFITNKNNMQINGLAVFHDGYLIGELNSMDSICHLILTNKLENAIISIPDPFDNTEIINLSLIQTKAPRLSASFINGSPYIKCNLNLNANIVSLSSTADYSSTEKMKVISEYANSYLESHLSDYLYKTAKEYYSDIVGFGKLALKKFKTLDEWNNKSWNLNYKNSFFDVNVNINLVNANLFLKN